MTGIQKHSYHLRLRLTQKNSCHLHDWYPKTEFQVHTCSFLDLSRDLETSTLRLFYLCFCYFCTNYVLQSSIIRAESDHIHLLIAFLHRLQLVLLNMTNFFAEVASVFQLYPLFDNMLEILWQRLLSGLNT
jgi:hypothetical protein